MLINQKLIHLAMLGSILSVPGAIPDTPVADESEDFHAHLGRCDQCANHPFNLCATGDRLIVLAASEVDATAFQ